MGYDLIDITLILLNYFTILHYLKYLLRLVGRWEVYDIKKTRVLIEMLTV